MPKQNGLIGQMNIYIEFKRDRLRVKIGSEQLETIIQGDFYSSIPGTESSYMFRDKVTIEKLEDLVNRHREKLGFFKKIQYWSLHNRVLVLVDNEVQKLATIGQIFTYATCYLDGRIVAVINKPLTFDSSNLADVEKLKDTSINRGWKIKKDIIISELA
jgi:hypothetical protein